ncbi:T9SS type A sorting domain-containing protein [Adhaeribacter aerolatus]|uniref:T9SS type A sorting domain-containing protein n=1 Tax=Adhaeribacter aerolatus TaxID=670289 RepID=UPI00147962A0|nr:T9SS type A sorting domain-containing protein [Adhaeribacter aerolatus]
MYWLIIIPEPGKAQDACMLVPAPLPQRVEQATVILEGKVVAQKSFWDAGHQNIYTANTVEVYKILKGRLAAPEQVEIITEGGTVGDKMHVYSATLALKPGQQGIFFLEPLGFPAANQVLTNLVRFSVYSSLQGFIRYQLPGLTAREPFRTYHSIQNELYPLLLAFPDLKLITIKENADLNKPVIYPNPVPNRAARTQAIPAISGFSPDTITAGTGSVLTITGQNFGSSRDSGFVEFKNANDGGATYIKPLASDYISWSDNLIRVKVPSIPADDGTGVAGTGQFRVMNGTDTRAATSPAELAIRYAVSNVLKEEKAYQPYHIDANGNGGYTIQFAANVPEAARAAFRRSMQTWTCYTNINWVADAVTSTAIISAEDNINLVRLADAGSLPSNVLGRTVSRYQGCQLGSNYSYLVSEFDFEFNDRTSWQFGPATPAINQFDFETTTLHELGHAHQLAHMIQPRSVMHYSISRTQVTRSLSGRNDVEGGNHVTNRSFQNNICNHTRMVPRVSADCTLPANLLSFEAVLQTNGTALLTWVNQNESNLAFYEIQKSIDAIAWHALARQAASSTNGRSYTFTDPRPGTGFTYYRLRLGNKDNQYNFSPSRRIGTDTGLAAGLQLFPNPIQEHNLHFAYQAPANGRILIRIYDIVGREHTLLVRNVTAGSNPFYFSMPGLKSGLYVLQVIQEKEVHQARFIKP